MLSPYRVLDLSTERGLLCGQILGDLGADVIQIEPPGGSPARALGPFLKDEPHPDRSIYWWAHTRNKRSITLDTASEEGRALLARLIAGAHFLIESDTPGALAERGLDYDEVAELNPALIYVSITPFGQTGPKAGYADSDLVMLAAAGPLVLSGDEDRPPIRVSVPQAYAHASADAAGAALIAHHERSRSGRGQHVDVAAQQSVACATQSAILAVPLQADELHRMSQGVRLGPLVVRLLWPAADGYVAIAFAFGAALGPFTRRLMEWIHEEGACEAALLDRDWIGYNEALLTGREPIDEYERLKDTVAAFTAERTKAELLRAALERTLLIAPVTTIEESFASEQLAAREFWRSLRHPELDLEIRYPGPFARFSETPIRYRRRPPCVGEHNRDIYVGELGLSDAELAALEKRGLV